MSLFSKSVLKLFKAFPINEHHTTPVEPSIYLLRKTLEHGIILSPELNDICIKDYEIIIDEYGLTGEQMNRAFHKSWSKVRDTPLEILYLEQMFHYITTYGFGAMGVYDKDLVYIPEEEMNIPGIDMGKIPITVIKSITISEIKEKLMHLIQSGIALKEETIECIMVIIDTITFSREEVDTIKNKEVFCRVCEMMNITPRNPTEFLRLIIYKTTGNTLLIKNKSVIIEVRANASKISLTSIHNCGLGPLATIFYRYKPIFLALRNNDELKPSINKIRKLAKKLHKPMPEDYLNSITSKIKKSEAIMSNVLYDELKKSGNIFRKIRLANALKYRTTDANSILYKVRNGKGFATDFSFDKKEEANNVYKFIMNSIVEDIKPNVEGKIFYIPKNINYTLPATEKQFSGDLPSGSSVTIDKNMIFGIHWENVNNQQIDLDLALISKDVKMGWDGNYSNIEAGILFSGDMTDAPKEKGGASELFFIGKQVPGEYLVTVNFYNYTKSIKVPFKIMVAYDSDAEKKDIDVRKYVIDPNNVIASTNTLIDQPQKVIGMLTITKNKCVFNFVESNVGIDITSRENIDMSHIRNYIFNSNTCGIDLKSVLRKAGAVVIDEDTLADPNLPIKMEYIELDPNSVNRSTFIDLLS